MFGGIALGVFAVSAALERKRREAFEQYALAHGLAFDAEGVEPQRLLSGLFPLFETGRSQRFRYSLKGTRGGFPFTAFEFKYVTGGGRSSQTHYLSLMSWRSQETTVPNFYVGPEGWWERIKQRFGAQDFDFDEDPAFSATYVLQGGDEKRIRELFDGGKRAFLVSHPDTHAAGTGPYLLWWRVQRLPAPDNLEAFFAEGDSVRQLFFN